MATTGATPVHQQDEPARRSPSRRVLVPTSGDMLLVGAFVVVHAALWCLNLLTPNLPLGDVTWTYARWVAQGEVGGGWIGLDSAWVYPVLALLPMMLAAFPGTHHEGVGWLALMTLLDAVALLTIWRYRIGGRAGGPGERADGRGGIRTGRRAGIRVGWWWLAFLLLLGPIALGRIDTVAVALGVIGVGFVASRPAIASAMFTLGAWIKVWPAALVVVLLLRRGHRAAVVTAALVVTAIIVALDIVLGGAPYLLSFVGQQTGRGLQVEAPLATAFLWQAWAHVPGTYVYYDQQILTFQVTGSGTNVAAAVSTPLMALVVVAVVLLAVRAVLGGARRAEIAPVVALALTSALIVTNKVGSPQYIAWLAVPVLWGLMAGAPSTRRFRVPAVLALVCALGTQLIYPYLYDKLLIVDPVQVAILSVRNAVEIAILVWAVIALVRIGNAREGRITPAPDLPPVGR